MPALVNLLARRAGLELDHVSNIAAVMASEVREAVSALDKRINIPCCNSTSPSGLVEANTIDPFFKSSKYALGWVYFCIILLVLASAKRYYHMWTDKIRTALYKEDVALSATTATPDSDLELKAFPSALPTDRSTQRFFPQIGRLPQLPKVESNASSFRPLNMAIAMCRYVFYRPIPAFQVYRLRKHIRPIIFPGLGALSVIFVAFILVICYCFVPQPLYRQSIQYGSPPLAIRAGMIAVAMMPWIVGLSMKANIISWLTGVGHERLNVLHRWLAYLCLLLSLIHTIPFYVTPIWDQGGLRVFRAYFPANGVYIYGTGKIPFSH